MHDMNPLGLTMYLRELDRQATPKLRPLRPKRRHGYGLAGLEAAVIMLLQSVRPTFIRWPVARNR